MNTNGASVPRISHAAVWTGSEMIVWAVSDGGENDSILKGGRYNPATDTWAEVNSTGGPLSRTFPTAIWTGREMMVWGGQATDVFPGGR